MEQKSSVVGKPKHILIAGIGNIFFGDDGFGVEVAQRLISRKVRPYSENVQVIDFGIRGIDLAYTLLDGYDALVLVDAVPRGGPVGTLYLIEPDLGTHQAANAGMTALDGHSMDPVKVLAFARTIGAPPIRTLLVGCEPSAIDEEMQMGLSEQVRGAVGAAIKMIDTVIEDLNK
jgi:hydrogenase maturation protease